jgi:hypothetical protein|tara:strand:- start:782 stop:1198 length:417 start_codon:yes stop_codon:yes gene_type:complete
MLDFVEIASVIQMAVAPAFLLTGVGAILTVMTARLTRIVDRFRVLHENSKDLKGYKQKELNLLMRRAKWTHWAIALTTISALLICVLIAVIFISTEISFDFNQFISTLFIIAMTSLIFGLLSFLKEVGLSKSVINIDS